MGQGTDGDPINAALRVGADVLEAHTTGDFDLDRPAAPRGLRSERSHRLHQSLAGLEVVEHHDAGSAADRGRAFFDRAGLGDHGTLRTRDAAPHDALVVERPREREVVFLEQDLIVEPGAVVVTTAGDDGSLLDRKSVV